MMSSNLDSILVYQVLRVDKESVQNTQIENEDRQGTVWRNTKKVATREERFGFESQLSPIL